ncbi:MAG TPA: hypothetical protein VG759_00010 [Candidatus Angelobacter sp.]|nr:hypothetical protein [Candidatus Angelobacter sp.]
MTVLRVAMVCWVMVWACFYPHLSKAQERCDAVRPLPGSASGYQQRGNRCEGLYVTDVGSQSLDVVSFTRGSPKFDLSAGGSLRVSASTQTSPVHIRAVAIPPRTYYRMDATLARGAVLVWPVGAVLLPESLSANRIGVYGWTGAENKKTFIPVQIVPQGSEAAAVPAGPALLYVQPSFDADQVKWRWAPVQKDACSVFQSWKNAIESPVDAGWPVKINLSQLPAGLNCIEVAANSQRTPWRTIQIRVEIP